MKPQSRIFSQILRNASHPYLGAGLLLAGAGFWASTAYNSSQSQKSHNTIFRALIMYLNKNDESLKLLGDNITHNEAVPVKGTVNILKGKADLEFYVKGEKGDAKVHFKGNRMQDSDFWESSIFRVQNEKSTINL